MPRGVKGSGQARATTAHVPTGARAVASAPAPKPSEPAEDSRPLASVNVDLLQGEALRRYALRAGLRKADVEQLSEDRLRQNVKLFIVNHFELIDEGV